MPHTWTYDAPTGSYKQHALSKTIRKASIEDAHFVEFAQIVDGFGKNKGENVTIVRLGTLAEPTDGTIPEGSRVPEDIIALSRQVITVTEMARSVPYTSLARDLSEFDLENPIQMRLKEQLKLTLDTACAVAFRAASVKYAPTGVTARNIQTNGTFGATATANLNVFHVEEIADYLFDTLRAPRLPGDAYVAIARTLALRGIRRDPQWEAWHQYTTPEAKARGETGMIEDVRFVKTNHVNALRLVGTANILGECVFFGADNVALAEAITPELRAAIPDDYGRSLGVAWYGILAFGIIWDTGNPGEARIVHVGSL